MWPALRRAHARLATPLCSLIHRLVVALDTRVRLPVDLRLKHLHDYRVVELDPALVQRTVHTGDWADPTGSDGRLGRLRRRLSLGGGWKHLQRHVTRNLQGRFIAPGDWDLASRPFVLHPSVVQVFIDGAAPSDTAEHARLSGLVATGALARARGCRSAEDVDRYFVELHELRDAIREGGYRPQAALGAIVPDEIRVCIDRHGRPCLFGGGGHRLSIALLLGVARVPVVVKRVHPLWVEHWRRLAGTDDAVVAIERGLDELLQAGAADRPVPSGRPL